MSTLSAARADNMYYPPEWEPKHGSINKFHGQHPLRERARKLDQGILIIRFEMPFHIWCGGCGKHIGKGTRYNADKKKVGKYYTTPIYSFTMKCQQCPNKITIETDPKACDYKVVKGGKKKNEEFTAEDNETIPLMSDEEKSKLALDPMFQIEHQEQGRQVAKKRKNQMEELLRLKERYADDYGNNSLLRSKFRVKRREARKQAHSDGKMQKRLCIDVPLVAEDKADVELAKSITYGKRKSIDVMPRRRQKVCKQSIFAARSGKHTTAVKPRRALPKRPSTSPKQSGLKLKEGGKVGSLVRSKRRSIEGEGKVVVNEAISSLVGDY